MGKHLLIVLFFCILIWGPDQASAIGTVFTYRSPESATDKRYDYDNAVLRLALEKTREEWGDYTLVPSPTMNISRAITLLETEILENPMFKLSANNTLCSELNFAPFPVDLGIVGHRLFFVSKNVDGKLSRVTTIDELKKFSIGQGYGWLDVEILTAAGFSVVLAPSYESLFRMVAVERFDLLSRGVNEVAMEYESHKDIPNFMLNAHIGLYYPLPRFFFTNKKSKGAARRVYEGLVKAYQDGSLLNLWEQQYRSSIAFGNIRNVKFFRIDNPFIDEIDPSYKQFMLKVME